MKKLLVTGAGGFLGQRTAAYYASSYEVVPCTHQTLDITNEIAVHRLIAAERPDFVLHCAAIADTGYAQAHPKVSEAVNLRGTVNLAKACATYDAKLVYMSSDQVYSGNTESFALPEEIPLSPNNIYGLHKLQAEKEAAACCPGAVALRLTWMYDLPSSSYKSSRNLLSNIDTASHTGTPLRGATHELRGITSVWEVISRFAACFALPGGVYNYGCENHLNTYETLCQAVQLCGADPATLVIADSEFCRNLSIDTTKLRSFGISFPNTIEGLRIALANKR